MANVPQITSLPTAIRLYYERIELNNPQIRELFGNIGSARIASLKKAALNQMAEDGCSCWGACFCTGRCGTGQLLWFLPCTSIRKKQSCMRSGGGSTLHCRATDADFD